MRPQLVSTYQQSPACFGRTSLAQSKDASGNVLRTEKDGITIDTSAPFTCNNTSIQSTYPCNLTDDESWDGETRYIDADLLRDHLEGDLNDYRYLVAGPPPMTEAVVDKLKEAGIPEDQIAADRFSGY